MIPARLRRFLTRHPLVRDALLWALPAILFAAALRALVLAYLPYAHWGSDSKSYYGFAHQLLTSGDLSLGEKRRYLYPLLLAPVSLLPGSPLRWLAIFQHLLGLATLVPLAYVVRKTLVRWRLWIVPVTVAYGGMPLVIWYEHELLAENVFFALVIWTFAGWAAWTGEARLDRARRLFWCFFIPLALFLLTKPSGRFVLPGVCVGLVFIAAWRRLDWKQWAALGALAAVTLTVGAKKQGAWLLYVACFPLTPLDTPLHAEYKAEIRDLVEPLRGRLDSYYAYDEHVFQFLKETAVMPPGSPPRPHWASLDNNSAVKMRVFLDLSKEIVRTHPLEFLYLGATRLLTSANPSQFKENRFESETFRSRFADDYAEGVRKERGQVRRAFGLPAKGPLPPWEEFAARLTPRPGSWPERTVTAYTHRVSSLADLVRIPRGKTPEERSVRHLRATPLGWWLLGGLLLAIALPAYRRTLGVWAVIMTSYLFGVFLCSQSGPRYFAPAWPVLLVLMAVPADALLVLLLARFRKTPAVEAAQPHSSASP